MSGKKKQNTMKPTVVSDGQGRLLWLGATRPGRMHDITALRTEGIEDLFRQYPGVKAKVDTGYQGLARDFPGQVTAPPKKPRTDAPPDQTTRWKRYRKATVLPAHLRRTCHRRTQAVEDPQRYSDAGNTSKTPRWPSPDWFLTAAAGR